MNKKIVGLICGCVLIAGLAAAVAVVSNKKAAEESEAEISASENLADPADLVLSSQTANDVSSIDIDNSKGSYTIVRTAKADAEAGIALAFGVKGWEKLPTNTAVAGTLANNTAGLSASSVVTEDCTDMDKYGLGDDADKAVLHFDDGSSFAFRIGNSVADGENNYFAIEGDDTVYAVKTSLVSNFRKDAESFLSLVMLPSPEDESNAPIVQKLTIKRDDMNKDIVLEYAKDANNENTGGTAASHEMTSPIHAYLSVDRSKDIITGLIGGASSGVVKALPQKSDIAQYGLDKPFCTVTLEMSDGNVNTLSVGRLMTEKDEETDTETSFYPVMMNGVDVIYKMTEEKCPWATVTPTDLASSLVLTTYVWDIDRISVKAEGEEDMDFVVNGEDKNSASVTLNSKAADSERYRKFYTFLLQTTAEGTAIDEKPVGKPVAEIKFNTKNGKKNEDICFYRQDDYTCLITINGVSSFRCRSSFVDALKKNMELFGTDEDFIMTWS